ncbi:MAG: hypothetical protein K6F23_14210 [Solobacterium sp.]|nr:hypothetical protein [Solobacterium sp.]
METKDLKKLRRGDLLEILVDISEENDRLRQENAELKEKLEEKRLIMNKAGSIAEASLRLNRVFEAVQDAADQYLASIRDINIMKREELRKLQEMTGKNDDTEENEE